MSVESKASQPSTPPRRRPTWGTLLFSGFIAGAAVGLIEAVWVILPIVSHRGGGVLLQAAGFVFSTAALYGWLGILGAGGLSVLTRPFQGRFPGMLSAATIAAVTALGMFFVVGWLRVNYLTEFAHSYTSTKYLLKDLGILAVSLVVAGVLFALVRSRLVRDSGGLSRVATIILISLLGAAAVWGHRVLPSGENPDNQPNLLFLGIDTLRADRLSAYGYERPTSPVMEQLAAGGVLFEQHVNNNSSTGPSHTQLFTSTSMETNNVVFNADPMPEDIETLFETLRDAGYALGGFSSNRVLSADRGYDRGFDAYQSFVSKHNVKTLHPGKSTPYLWRHYLAVVAVADRLLYRDVCTGAALDWLARNSRRPFCLWVQWLDPHEPMEPTPDFAGRFSSGLDSDHFPSMAEIEALRDGDFDLKPEEEQYFNALYDECILQTDFEVGRVLEAVEKLGQDDNTLTVLWADHGQNLYEHFEAHGEAEPGVRQVYAHGKQLYDSLLMTPLIIRYPGFVPADLRVEEQVSTMDVAPTILDYLGIDPPDTVAGASLRGLMDGEGSGRDVVVSRVYKMEPPVISARSADWKLIAIPPLDGEPRTNLELYNLSEDSDETENVLDRHPDIAIALGAAIDRACVEQETEAFLVRLQDRFDEELDEKTRQQMKALGYVR